MITPEAVELFRRAVAIENAEGHEMWESEGGRRREYLDLGSELRTALGLQSHEYGPTTPSVVDYDEPPDGMAAHRIKNWRRAAQLRRELLVALADVAV